MTMRRAGRVSMGMAAVGLGLFCARAGVAFQRQTPVPAPQPDYSGRQSSGSQIHSPFEDSGMQALEEKRDKSLNTERQRLMVRDAEQLVQSAAELEARVSQDPRGAGREDEAKRAETIEKLAKSVKDRMRGMR